MSSRESAPRPSQRSSRHTSSSSYFSYPVSVAVSGIIRRLSTEPNTSSNRSHRGSPSQGQTGLTKGMNGGYFSASRTASPAPFQPPPLTPLNLEGWRNSTNDRSRLLTRALAEEIRLLFPPRNQLVDRWRLIYGLDQDGSSLSTLYKRAEDYRGKRGGFVLVVRDSANDVFGAYLSDAPHPAPHFYGTGECFLWRSSILPSMPTLASLPPPPSEDTTHAQRMTTIGQPKRLGRPGELDTNSRSGTATPELIRFKAFPYSGENDYMIFCESGYLSIGGGDGHYGLWLDDDLANGVSSSCPTFGNEPLSDQGKKFEVLGVELWFVGS